MIERNNAMPMTDAEVANMREEIANMIGSKTEAEVRAYLDANLARMPKEMQEELLMSMFITSIRQETEEIKTLAAIQKEGLSAIEELEVMRKEAEAEQE